MFACELLDYLHGAKGTGVGVPSPEGTKYYLPVIYSAPDGEDRLVLVSEEDPRLPDYPDPVQDRPSGFLRLYPNNSILYDDVIEFPLHWQLEDGGIVTANHPDGYGNPPTGSPPRRRHAPKRGITMPAAVNGTPPGVALPGHGAPSIAPVSSPIRLPIRSPSTIRMIGPAVGPLASAPAGPNPTNEGLSTSGAFITRPISALGTALGFVMGVAFTLWLL
jgi:hypothetical protein